MVKKITWFLSVVALTTGAFSFRGKFYSFQPPPNYSGAPGGNGVCSNCHSNLNSGGGSVTVNGLPAHFQPGQTYPFSVTITHPSAAARWGFEINARNANGTPVGTFTSTNPNATTNGGAWELSHYNAVVSAGTTYTYNNLFWTAPATINTGDNNVSFYVAGNAANGDGNFTGDFIYTNVVQFTLPITLTAFTYKIINEDKVQLDWATASESRSKEFVIEKSDDNNRFYESGRVAAAGQSSTEQSYTYTDNNPSYFNQPVYYRLKMVDEDGSFKYSKILQLTLKGRATYVYSLSPNPATDYLNIGIFADRAKRTELSIVSAGGRLLSTRVVQVQAGKMTYRIPITPLSHGPYFLKLRSDDVTQTLSFVAL